MRVARPGLVVLLVLVALLLPALSSLAPPAGASSHQEGPLRLEVLSVGPAVLRAEGTVDVTAVLHNDGPETFTDLSVRLMAYSERLSTREAVHAWATDDFGIRSGNRFLADMPVTVLPPGAEVPIALEAPAAELGLSGRPSAWGPRGLTLEVIDTGDGSFDQLAVARGFTVWDPRTDTGPRTDVSLLVPLTAGPPDVATGLLPPELLAELTEPGGRLERVLDLASLPQVGWAVDPAVLASAARPDATASPGTSPGSSPSPGPATPATPGTGGPTTPGETTAPTGAPAAGDPTSAAQSAGTGNDWLERVREQARGRTVLTLPRSDPDLVGLSNAGAGELYTFATRMARRPVTDVLDWPSVSDVAWPVGGTAGEAALALAAEAGVGTVVLSGGAHPPVDETRTPTGRSTLQVGQERLDALLVDTGLSATLTAATQGEDAALAASRLLAETAAITAGSEDPPHVLLALPRDWDPDPDVARAVLQALRSAPWLSSAPLVELLDSPPDDVERRPLAPDVEVTAALPPDGLRDIRASVLEARRISSALTRPDDLLDEVEQSAVAATGVAWLEDLGEWRRAVERFGSAADAVSAGIHVVEGSDLTVVSSEVDLPVTVANELGQDVAAVVSVQPRSPRLVAESDVEVTIPAQSTERVAVPVRAVANGDTEVVVTVRAPDGALLGEPVEVEVRVRADWETRGMLVVGAVLAGVLVVGLVRTIRRGPRARVAASDEGTAP